MDSCGKTPLLDKNSVSEIMGKILDVQKVTKVVSDSCEIVPSNTLSSVRSGRLCLARRKKVYASGETRIGLVL